MTNVTQDTQDAVDIVLVVDESGSMINEQQWLLIMVPLLEQVLTSAGVCLEPSIRRRSDTFPYSQYNTALIVLLSDLLWWLPTYALLLL